MTDRDLAFVATPAFMGNMTQRIINFKLSYSVAPFVYVWFEKREAGDDDNVLPYFYIPSHLITTKGFTVSATPYDHSKVKIHYRVYEIKKIKREAGTIYD